MKNEVLDELLSYYREQAKKGNFFVDGNTDSIYQKHGLDHVIESNLYEQELVNRDILQENQNGNFYKGKNFDSFKGFVIMELRELRQEILKTLEPTYISGSLMNLNDFFMFACPEMKLGPLANMLRAMNEDQLISDNAGFRGLSQRQNLTVRQFVGQGNSLPLKLLKAGYMLLNPQNYMQSGNTFNVTGPIQNLVNASPGAITGSYNQETLQAIDKIIELFNQIRTEDISLFAAALKDAQEQKQIDVTKYERFISFVANLMTIVSSVPK